MLFVECCRRKEILQLLYAWKACLMGVLACESECTILVGLAPGAGSWFV